MQIEAWGFPCLGLLSSVVSPATATEPYRVSNGIALLLSVAPAQMTGITYDTCSSSIILLISIFFLSKSSGFYCIIKVPLAMLRIRRRETVQNGFGRSFSQHTINGILSKKVFISAPRCNIIKYVSGRTIHRYFPRSRV